ncbi:hypothetical protein SDC9_173305 [bioreactor metagenome]|uniref:Uncharacterized protein n=1 Tax=bioreactor metagenome TaxID=1076179 RepID=A0A645GG39_9ZZZZ
MHLVLVRIVHIGQRIYSFIEQRNGFIMCGHDDIDIGKPIRRNLRQRKVDLIRAVFPPVELIGSQRGGNLAHQQQDAKDKRDRTFL